MKDKLKIVVMSNQSIVPLNHGAAFRIYNLLKQLAGVFDVTLITSDSAKSNIQDKQYGLNLQSLRVLSDGDISGSSDLSFVQKIDRRLELLRHKYNVKLVWRNNPFGHMYEPKYEWYHIMDSFFNSEKPDIVIVEHVWHIKTLTYIRRRWPKARYILDAHNVESENLHRYLQKDKQTGFRRIDLERQIRHIRKIESTLSHYVDAVWACSRNDLDMLMELNQHSPLLGFVIPNGVDTRYFMFAEKLDKHSAHAIIYSGILDYGPSLEAACYFYKYVWPLVKKHHPNIKFMIVGRNPPKELKRLARKDDSLSLIGQVPDVRPYFRQSSVHICPILSGSGTRIKILNAMSLGNPVVSTTVGAEGIDAQPGKHILIADKPAEFAQKVLNLLEDKSLFENIRRQARRLVEEKYDWDIIGKNAISAIQQMYT